MFVSGKVRSVCSPPPSHDWTRSPVLLTPLLFWLACSSNPGGSPTGHATSSSSTSSSSSSSGGSSSSGAGGGVTSSTTTSSSSSSSSGAGGGATSTSSSTSSSSGAGGGASGHTSIGWAFDYPDDVFNVIGQHKSSFTHVATLVYDIVSYSGSGVVPFWNTPGGADVFQNGLTSTTMATKVHGMGLKYLATILGGAELDNGDNQPIVTILDAPSSFISSMVQEGVTKKYDGYALDWEMGGGTPNVDDGTYDAKMEAFLGAFKAALNAHGMILSIAIVPNDIKQSCTSYGNGVFDLTQLGNSVDLVMLEDYATSLGTPASSCPAGYKDPAGCLGLTSVFLPFADEVALLCSTLKPGTVNIILNSSPMFTNPFAGGAVSVVEAYGVASIGLFPQINANGPGGTYAVFDATGIQPSGSDWFTLLAGFLK
jgi:hypothetical protein